MRVKASSARTTSYNTRIDVRSIWGVFVDVSAKVNLATGLVTLDLSAIDPLTMQVPLDPVLGFMPPNPNNMASLGGSLSYFVGVRANAADGTSLDASAVLTFNGGSPFTTATVHN